MSKIISRIKQFADSQGVSNRELERTIGVSDGVLSKAFRCNTEIRTDCIEAIVEKYPHLSAEWLLRGEGEMLRGERLPDSEAIVRLAEIIAQQAEEIGRLKALLNNKGGETANIADRSSCANVG